MPVHRHEPSRKSSRADNSSDYQRPSFSSTNDFFDNVDIENGNSFFDDDRDDTTDSHFEDDEDDDDDRDNNEQHHFANNDQLQNTNIDTHHDVIDTDVDVDVDDENQNPSRPPTDVDMVSNDEQPPVALVRQHSNFSKLSAQSWLTVDSAQDIADDDNEGNTNDGLAFGNQNNGSASRDEPLSRASIGDVGIDIRRRSSNVNNGQYIGPSSQGGVRLSSPYSRKLSGVRVMILLHYLVLM